MNRPRIDDEGNEPDVTTAGRADKWERLGDTYKQLGPRDAGGVVGEFFGRGLGGRPRRGGGGTLTPVLSRRAREQDGVADRQRGHKGPQRMIGRKQRLNKGIPWRLR